MKAREIAEKCNVSVSRIYQLARSLGRLPTVEEVENKKNSRGRPQKYKEKQKRGKKKNDK